MNTTEQRFIAYSDGSCDNLNPQRPGGSAYIILDNSGAEIKRMSKGFMHTTNNRMEMLAIISIVNSLPSNSSVTINTDSEYCIKALLSHCPEKNLDLVALYHKIVNEKSIMVEFQHVKGHSGNFYNEECDRMAREKYNEMLTTLTPTKKVKKGRKTKKRKYETNRKRMTTQEFLYHLFRTGQITIEEYLKSQELPSETINIIRKAIKEHETNRK